MQIILNGIIVAGIYALFAIGFNLIYSTVRFFHIAYGAIALFASYFTFYLQKILELNFVVSAVISIVLTSFIGLLAWIFIYKPLKKRGSSDLVMMVSAFGLLLVLQNLIALLFSNNFKGLSLSDTIKPGYEIFGLFITANQSLILLTSILVLLLINLILKKTKAGLMIRAVGENAELAKINGLPVNKIIYLVFLIGTGLSAVASILTSLEIGMKPTYSLFFILKAIIASIIGGIGSSSGALYGALILGISENIGIYYFGGSWQDAVAFALLAIFLLFRPQGIMHAQKLIKT